MALILLDAGMAGLAILDPRSSSTEGHAFRDWYASTAQGTHRFALADVTRYEVRRGLLQKRSPAKLSRLDLLMEALFSVPTSLAISDRAAEFWAQLRHEGKPTAADGSLDGDAILAATAITLATEQSQRVIVATTNVRHLTWFGVDARPWQAIADND